MIIVSTLLILAAGLVNALDTAPESTTQDLFEGAEAHGKASDQAIRDEILRLYQTLRYGPIRDY